MRILVKNKVKMVRDEWLEEALASEKSGTPMTCASIVKNCLDLGL